MEPGAITRGDLLNFGDQSAAQRCPLGAIRQREASGAWQIARGDYLRTDVSRWGLVQGPDRPDRVEAEIESWMLEFHEMLWERIPEMRLPVAPKRFA